MGLIQNRGTLRKPNGISQRYAGEGLICLCPSHTTAEQEKEKSSRAKKEEKKKIPKKKNKKKKQEKLAYMQKL